MGVNFSSPINCAVTPPGGQTTATTQSETFSAPANVTASISADTSGGALTVLSITSFVLQTEIETPDPGELPPGTPPKPIKITVPVQVATVTGGASLSVASGQYVVVTVQFAPIASTPNTATATLVVTGDTWSPASVSVPITATLGEIKVKVPAIFVVEGGSTSVPITVTLVAGANTSANLILGADGSADAPNVTATIGSSSTPLKKSISLTKGTGVPVTLKVSAGSTLAAGQYSWSLAVWSYDNSTSFSVPVLITVGVPYYFIKSKLGNVIDISTDSTSSLVVNPEKTGTDSQLWNFEPDPAGSGCYYIVNKGGKVIDIEEASTKAGASLDAHEKKDGANNQLWYFVTDPGGSGDCFIVSKLNGNVIDIQETTGPALDAFPVKFTGYNNQLWSVVKGSFPSVEDTVNAPGLNLGGGFQNYVLQNGGDALDGVSVTIKIKTDFVSSANGYSFQLNCNSPNASDVTTQWQQFLIFTNAGSNQLIASVQTWFGPSVSDLLNNIQVPLATLPGTTLPAGYSMNITLNYYNATPDFNDPSSLVAGATFTVSDNHGNSIGNTTITIIGNDLASTGNPATVANLAAIDTMQLNIGGWENSTRAALTGGTGEITYDAAVPLSAQWGLPSYVHLIGTAESSNTVFGPLPWPFSVSMDDDEPSGSIVQLFEAVVGLGVLEPLEMRKIRAPRPQVKKAPG
jgi:hypothetical protein